MNARWLPYLWLCACACGPMRQAAVDAGEGPVVAPRLCAPPPGVSSSPRSIEEAVALINALPKPTRVACLVSSLDRPLRLAATSSVFSAQPAVGVRSPRIFLFSGALIISIVPEGEGAALVEFSVLGEDLRSRKGELVFPITSEAPAGAPYEGLMFNETLTSCGLCHGEERPDVQVGGQWSYTSRALRPRARDLVPLEALRQEADACDATAEPERCELLEVIFSGEVREQAFPPALPTLFD